MDNQIQTAINKLYEDSIYEYEQGHGIPLHEEEIWQLLITSLGIQPLDHVLEIGSGTGLLSHVLAKAGFVVTGMDSSITMLAMAQAMLQTSAVAQKMNFFEGDTHNHDVVPRGSTQLIVSRQVVCHFYDPLLVFQNWYHWLKPDGSVVILDGLWSRKGWSNETLIDQLPLSCLQTRATVSYLLERSGFDVLQNDWIDPPNVDNGSMVSLASPRYIIVARKKKVMVLDRYEL